MAENRIIFNIYQSVMCYISMDSSEQALQINGKLFYIWESFFELTTIFKIIVALGFCMCGGEGD